MAVDHVARNMAMDAGGGAAPVDITQIVTEAVAQIVADAPEDFDTLKEMSDWIASHEDSAAAMNSAILQNTADIEETNALLDTKPGMKSSTAFSAEVFNDLAGNTASGQYSHAEGLQCTASGPISHAEGRGCTASGQYSHAEGLQCTASELYSHAEGANSKASGTISHAEGSGCTASGQYSHAEGSGCTASGGNSHAEGGGCTASGSFSHAEGIGCTAIGSYSHAEGSGCKAEGNYSHAEGQNTTALGSHSHVQGRYNVMDGAGKFAYIIGNGSYQNPHNAFAIDWEGKIYVNGSTTGVNVEDLFYRILALAEEVAELQA